MSRPPALLHAVVLVAGDVLVDLAVQVELDGNDVAGTVADELADVDGLRARQEREQTVKMRLTIRARSLRLTWSAVTSSHTPVQQPFGSVLKVIRGARDVLSRGTLALSSIASRSNEI